MSAMTGPSSSFTDYLIAELRCAVLRAKLWQNDLTAIGVALKAGFIGPDDAVAHLWNCDALRLVIPSSTITVASS